MLPMAPAVMSVRPTSTPVGALPFLSSERIHQIRATLSTMRNSDSRNLPTWPPKAMPKAMPSFSTKHRRNHCPIT